MSTRPVTRGAQSPREGSFASSGSLVAGDDGATRDIDHDSDSSQDDDPNSVKTKSSETLRALQAALDGLSQSQLLSVKDMVQKTAQPTRAQKSQRLRAIVDEHMQHLLTEDASAMYDELWHDLADADARIWTSIFSSFRPLPDSKPDLSEFPFHELVDVRPKATNHETTEAFKRFPKQQAIDEVLKSVADKQIRPLCRVAMAALDLGSTELSDNPDEVKAHADKMQVALIRMAQHTFMLHSDAVHRRKLAAFTAIGMKDYEANEQYRNALLDEKDFAFMKSVNDRRSEFTKLKAQFQTKQGKGRGRGRGRGRGADRGRQSDSSVPGAAAQSTSQSAPKEHHSETAAPSRGTSPGSTKGTSTSSGRGRGRGNRK